VDVVFAADLDDAPGPEAGIITWPDWTSASA
jgi:hypothetical protein